MRNIIESLSLGTGAALVAVFSVGVVWLLSSVCPTSLRKLWVVIVPFVFAYSLYWSPVWLGADPVGYHTWALLGVGAWFLTGVIPSGVLVSILEKRRSKATQAESNATPKRST